VAQVPADTMESLGYRAGQRANHVSRRVRDRDHDDRRFLLLFLTELCRRRIGGAFLLLLRLLLGVLALLLASLDRVLYVVRERRAKGRVVGRVEGTALEPLAAKAILPGLDIQERVLNGKEDTIPGQRLRAKSAQEGVVVEDVNAPAERADRQIALLPLNGQV